MMVYPVTPLTPPPSNDPPAPPPDPKAIRKRRFTGWALFAVGTILLALPWQIPFFGKQWVYEGLLGIAMASLGAILIVLDLSDKMAKRIETRKRFVGSIVLIGGFSIAVAYAIKNHEMGSSLRGIGVMGLLVLVTVLIGANLMSGEDHLTAEEIRAAITMALVASFLGLIAFGKDEVPAEGSLLAETFEHFWQVLIYAITFYFGATAVESGAKALAEGRKKQ